MQLNLDILNLARATAIDASKRQNVVASNIANADTPGYRARILQPFSTTFQNSSDAMAMRQTRPGHLAASNDSPLSGQLEFSKAEASPNGNTVSLETEMTKAAEIKQQYEMALTIYKKSMDILRTSLGR